MEGEVFKDYQWVRLERFVPGGSKGKRGPRSDGRRFLDAVLWLGRDLAVGPARSSQVPECGFVVWCPGYARLMRGGRFFQGSRLL